MSKFSIALTQAIRVHRALAPQTVKVTVSPRWYGFTRESLRQRAVNEQTRQHLIGMVA